ncbi:MAG: LLM class flavin-dependent oxidoreductase [Ilumatobacter sp.]|uniref:LLM class flavin-dependent oxidoreductase n=1 Tax=Ilumatobacter sp. TaxID=1967498 RepID=UPI00260176C4|nr:LLM class flavin-dependent oxidoreductase [Ilumatobacter sp.]MDJ0767856.1 LLM class flavin-dependent oxidoreductase [Ilumatobacter sp.]
MTVEMAWFSALCDDDYEFLGVPDPQLASSWEHCRNIVLTADRYGFDNVLLPSGYALGIDNTVFAAGLAPITKLRMLLAVRCGELVVPQLARQLATLDQMMGGRLTINIISSEMPGESLGSEPRYRRSTEIMYALRELLDGEPVDYHGDFVDLTIDPPRARTVTGRSPLFYFGGLSPAARECAAAGADVFLMWPDTTDKVLEVKADMDARAAAKGRTLRYGWRSHVIVRETEDEARAAARRLLSKLDDETGREIRQKSLDSASAGVAAQAALREGADDEGYADRHLWTGVGRARSGAGAAIVGDPDQVLGKINELTDAGMDAFILSGYPHAAECDLFSRYVLPEIDHGRLDFEPDPVVVG